MITSNAHPEDDPRGEEVQVGGTVVMTTERFESCLHRASPTQLLQILLEWHFLALPSLLYGPIALNTGIRRCLRYRRDPNELLMTLLWLWFGKTIPY